MEVTTLVVSDDWASDPTLSEREYLILSTLTLQRLEFRMFLSGYDGTGTLPEDIARCFRPTNHRIIRLAMAKTCMAFMANVMTALSASSGPDIPEELGVVLIIKYVIYLCIARPNWTLNANISARFMKEHLSHLLENERLLPLSDPLDITILHALLGFSIFNEVMLGGYRLSLPTNAGSTELFAGWNSFIIRLCDNGCRDYSPYAPSLLPRGLLAHIMRDARSHRPFRRAGSHVHR